MHIYRMARNNTIKACSVEFWWDRRMSRSTITHDHEIQSVASMAFPLDQCCAMLHSHSPCVNSLIHPQHKLPLGSHRIFQFEQSRFNWVTASELDSDTFETQRGADGIL